MTTLAGPQRVAQYHEGVSHALRALLIITSFILVAVALSGGFSMAAYAQTASAAPATAKPATAKLATVRPGDMNAGALLFETQTPGEYVQAPLVATDVTLDVTGIIARGTVTQRFLNPSDGWVEGIYVFPLPDDAAVDSLRMQIGDRFIEGQVKEKQEAREIYEEAKEQGFKASLVEQERPNIFTNSVANIGPGEMIVVQIAYQQTVTVDAGDYSIRFPMVVAPRYMPAPTVHMVDFQTGPNGETSGFAAISDPVPDRERISPPVLNPETEGKTNPVTLTVNLDAGFELGDVTSHHHAVNLDQDDMKATLTLDAPKGQVPADKDFELTWTAQDGTGPNAALFIETTTDEDGNETPYLLMMLTPPTGASLPDAGPREVVFVIDNSGSMSGPSMDQAKASLLLALDRLDTDDTFNVIRFDHEFDQVFPTAVRADKENLDIARAFVGNLTADGGTEMLAPLQASLQDANPTDTDRLRQVIFLTDGAIGNEVELFETISQGLGRSRLFTVGIGSAPNSFFMTRAAEVGRGAFTHIGSADQIVPRMAQLFEKLETPVITGLEMDWPARVLNEVWPNPLPDLYKGEPIVLTARLARAPKPGELLEVGGTFAGDPWLVQLPLAKAQDGEGIAKLWARRKIASLEGFRYSGGDWEKIDRDILAVALDHHLVSRLTSLVAVDVTPSRPDDENLGTAQMPVNLPDGWDFDKVFGGDPSPMPTSASITPDPAWQVLKVAAAPPAPVAGAKSVPLPQGSTPAPLLLLMGLIGLALGLALLALYRREDKAAA
ncbi:MAG: marine proteobacterial sortase target protein [Pseudomonadota bacterium]